MKRPSIRVKKKARWGRRITGKADLGLSAEENLSETERDKVYCNPEIKGGSMGLSLVLGCKSSTTFLCSKPSAIKQGALRVGKLQALPPDSDCLVRRPRMFDGLRTIFF